MWLNNTMLRKTFFIIVFTLTIIIIPFATAQADSEDLSQTSSAVIYYNKACGMCAQYLDEDLEPILRKQGIINIVKKDYINHRQYRQEMNDLFDRLVVPLELQSHIMTLVKDKEGDDYKYIIAGHVPEDIINNLFQPANNQRFQQIIVYQDKMGGEINDYKILAKPIYADNFLGKIQTYQINKLPNKYLDYLDQNKEELLKQTTTTNQAEDKSLLTLVLISGLLDGLNPCAFAVLIFFIAFLFTLQRGIGNIFRLGLVYVLVIYLTYLGIGFGLFKAIVITGQPHLMAKIGSWLVILLGLINIKDFIMPNLPFHLRIPKFSQSTLKHWLTKATLPAVIVAAFLVGLCTFPCSGGIYVAIIGLLASRGTFFQGFGYMLIYNLMFIIPLLVLLALAGNKYALGKVAAWQAKSDKGLKFWSGIIMIAIGIIILIWFV